VNLTREFGGSLHGHGIDKGVFLAAERLTGRAFAHLMDA
jgi:hypothetical protein